MNHTIILDFLMTRRLFQFYVIKKNYVFMFYYIFIVFLNFYLVVFLYHIIHLNTFIFFVKIYFTNYIMLFAC